MDPVTNEQLVERLQESVADRRAAGDYPPGLEEQLESHFNAMLRSLHHDHTGTEALAASIRRVGIAIGALGEQDVATSSRVPGGSMVHGAAASLVRRHMQDLSGRVGAVSSAVHEALIESARLFEATRSADERTLNGVLAMVMDRLAVVDHLSEMVVELEDRVRRLEAGSTE